MDIVITRPTSELLGSQRHDAIKKKKKKKRPKCWVTFTAQDGSCLYYFMFALICSFPCSFKLFYDSIILIMLLLLLLSHFSLCATPQTAAHQAPPSLGFSRQGHWSGLPFPSPMHESEKWKRSRSVMSDSSRPHRLQPPRLLHPWDFPGEYWSGVPLPSPYWLYTFANDCTPYLRWKLKLRPRDGGFFFFFATFS